MTGSFAGKFCLRSKLMTLIYFFMSRSVRRPKSSVVPFSRTVIFKFPFVIMCMAEEKTAL